MKLDYFLDQILCDVHVGKKTFQDSCRGLHPVRKAIYHFRMFMRHCFMVLRNFWWKCINRIMCHIWRHNSEKFYISFLFLFLVLLVFHFNIFPLCSWEILKVSPFFFFFTITKELILICNCLASDHYQG